jgi:hypothetical protein
MALVTDTHTKTESLEGTAEEFGYVRRPSGTIRLLDPTQDYVLG